MTQAASVITDEMRALVGAEGTPMALEVEKTNCRMFARAVGHTDPIYYDEAKAKARGYRGIVAPPGFMGTPAYNPSAAPQGPTTNRGYSIPYKRVLNGGTDYEYFPENDTICAGDTITAVGKISGFEETTGSLGPMLITRRETTYTNQHGKVVAKMYGTTIQY
jgi:hypothetical protein